MKALLITKSFVEVAAGLALLLIPSTLILLALGVPLQSSGEIAVARFTGLILLALGIACWVQRNHGQSRAAIRLIAVLLLYDLSVVVLLLLARFSAHLSGIALWPAILLHSGLASWSLFCLRNNPR